MAKVKAQLDSVFKKLEGNLHVLETSVTRLDEMLQKDGVSIDDAEIELQVMKQKNKAIMKQYETYIDLLQRSGLDYEANVQLQRQADLIRNMAFIDRHCRNQFKGTVDAVTVKTRPAADTHRASVLPKRELPKFDGNVRNWMSFWGAFEEIHNDIHLSDSEKLHYLLQSTVTDSPAQKVVSSFPASGANYQSAVDRLRERFGRHKTLIKVYMRDLLKLVVDNSTKENDVDFVDLVTLIDSQIRNLAQLGVTQDRFGELLYPVVESCIPSSVLENYLRSQDHKEELQDLMDFLQNEVRRRLETDLAQNQFMDEESKSTSSRGGRKSNSNNKNKNVKAAAGFLNTTGRNEKPVCIFCQKPNHSASDCRTAIKWDLEKRRNALKDKNACFKCFKMGHGTKMCRSRVMCYVCERDHHVLMCHANSKSKQHEDEEKEKPTAAEQQQSSQKSQDGDAKPSMANVVSRPEVLLQTLTVWIHGPRGASKARAAFDSLSQSSYIKDELARKLELPRIGEETVIHQTFGGNETKPQQHPIYKMQISGVQEEEKYDYVISGIPRISSAITQLPLGDYIEECNRKGISLTDLNQVSEEIEILIGADYGEDFKLGGDFVKLQGGPVAIHTKLGWVLSGRLNKSIKRKGTLAMMNLQATLSEKDVANLWSLETIGIQDPADTKSREDLEKSAMDHYQKTVSQDEDGRYIVQLPWIQDHPSLPDNRMIAVKRLHATTKKLKEEGHLMAYDAVFKSWLDDEIIQVAEPPENVKYCHYLPHRAVFKESSTTPIRPVFDASAKARNSPSLNDCLEKGPNLLELIPAILIRFRLDEFGLVADITKAFQQMKLAGSDQDKMRFLWWEDPVECKKMVEYKHARVVFGVSSSPFLLGATLKHHITRYPHFHETCQLLNSCFYVDNAVLSLPTMTDAKKFQQEACKVLSDGQFQLRGWEFGPCDEDKNVAIRGLIWNLKADTLQFDCRKLMANMGVKATKRNLYKMINLLFDPLGFVSPVTVTAKILLKKVCLTEKVGWDDKLNEEHSLEFERWKQQLTDLQNVCIPRHIRANSKNAQLSLHCMCDASMDSFATCVYLRSEEEGQVTISLVQSKTRVSPKKGVTIPRLELLGCLIGARLVRSVLTDMGKSIPIYYWTDSTTALTWIQKDECWATFVYNRVKQIRELSNPEDWRHVPGTLNPADIPSRGCSVRKLVEANWWSGPSWLYKTENEWFHATPTTNDLEVNKEKRKTVVSAVNMTPPAPAYIEEALMKCSSYPKILRVIAQMLRFTKITKKEPVTKGELSTEEMVGAEKVLIRYLQAKLSDSDLKKLETIKDDNGIHRLKTRLVYSQEKEDFVFPALLPGKHPIVKLMIQHEHEMLRHAGVQFLQSHLRERYWIIKSRRSIRNVIHQCAVCRRHLAKRCKVPEASSPLERVNTTKAFEVTGVDVTGPLFVEKGKKMWLVLFTCGVYRAVHLELVSSLSTEAFLGALQKFVARRGRPSTIFSDNGTNFTGTSNLLNSVKWDEVQRQASLHRIKWRFNPPTAAWWGGWWERLIGLVKQLLRRTLGNRFVKLHHLEVLIAEVESIMNDRPLTYLSEDPEDLRPLTPAHFLRDLPVAALPEVEVVDGRAFRMNLSKLQKLKQDLRERFRKEYLGQLIHRGKSGQATELNPGDVVLVEMENHKRLEWPMGIIMEVFPGKGHSRTAKVKTTKGIITRPFQRLFPLEVKTVKQNKTTAAQGQDPEDIPLGPTTGNN